VSHNREPYVAAALQELGNLHTLSEARASVSEITKLLPGSTRPETAIVAATALSVLATPGDPEAVTALKTLMFANEGEIAWSAAMALARLGDASGRTILMDMLDRSFWETGERYQTVDGNGTLRSYPMPPQRIDPLLIAAIEAASHVQDKALWDAIETLKSDPIPSVRTKAAEVASRRNASAAKG
jgi:HEAT repeat protein